MSTRPFPRTLLENPDTRSFFLQKQITDMSSMKLHLKDSVFLAVDVDGCGGNDGEFSAIGLAILPSIDVPLCELRAKLFQCPPFRTQEVAESCGIEAYFIGLADHHGRQRGKRQHPKFHFGRTIQSTKDTVGIDVQSIVDSIKQRLSKNIVLVAWHPQPVDFPGIQTLLPNLFREVIGWIDVSEMTRQVYISTGRGLAGIDFSKRWPSLENMLSFLGVSEDCRPSHHNQHAGFDAVHAIIVFLRLLTPLDDQPSNVGEMRRKRRRGRYKSKLNKAMRAARARLRGTKESLDEIELSWLYGPV